MTNKVVRKAQFTVSDWECVCHALDLLMDEFEGENEDGDALCYLRLLKDRIKRAMQVCSG